MPIALIWLAGIACPELTRLTAAEPTRGAMEVELDLSGVVVVVDGFMGPETEGENPEVDVGPEILAG